MTRNMNPMLNSFSPERLLHRIGVTIPWIALVAAGTTFGGLFLALIASPPDYQQGEAVRILYVHVPSAWMGLFVYGAVAAASAAGLVWHLPLAGFIARAMAPVGAVFTFICLVTGALWGKPMWGTWWVWDARLTSSLLLLFLYLGYIALQNAFDDPERGQKAASVLVLVGVINIPVIKFSVDWWNTLHQPASVFRAGGSALNHEMLWPLLLMTLAFKAYFILLSLIRVKAELIEASARDLSPMES